MIRRSTWIVLGLFAFVLVGAIYWQQAKPASTVEPTATVQPMVFNFEPGTIMEINLTSGEGVSLTYQIQDDETWALIGDLPIQVDANKVTTMLSQLASLSVLNSFKTPPADNLTGLDAPTLNITLIADAGIQYSLIIGTPTAIGSGYYARSSGAEVVVVSKSVIDSVFQLVQNPPIQIPTPLPAPPSGTEIAPKVTP